MEAIGSNDADVPGVCNALQGQHHAATDGTEFSTPRWNAGEPGLRPGVGADLRWRTCHPGQYDESTDHQPNLPGVDTVSCSVPTRTLIPTEEFRFHSSSIQNIAMNRRIRYTGATSNVPNFDENFLGQDNWARIIRVCARG